MNRVWYVSDMLGGFLCDPVQGCIFASDRLNYFTQGFRSDIKMLVLRMFLLVLSIYI